MSLSAWWGMSFNCAGNGVGKIDAPYFGCPETPPRMKGALYKDILTDYMPNATAPPFLNVSLQTKVLNFRNASGSFKQLWWVCFASFSFASGAVGIAYWLSKFETVLPAGMMTRRRSLQNTRRSRLLGCAVLGCGRPSKSTGTFLCTSFHCIFTACS